MHILLFSVPAAASGCIFKTGIKTLRVRQFFKNSLKNADILRLFYESYRL